MRGSLTKGCRMEKTAKMQQFRPICQNITVKSTIELIYSFERRSNSNLGNSDLRSRPSGPPHSVVGRLVIHREREDPVGCCTT
jgi:hypothetical protein